MKDLTLKPIAVIETPFPEKFGIPRQSGRVPSLRGRIVFLPEYRDPDALRGIEGFSHLWLLFDFSLSHRAGFSPTVRPPRLGGNTHVGVFASRSPFRPNPIGLSSVAFLGIEHTEKEGDVLLVGGADLLSGTPIFDIKPYIPHSDLHPEARGGYADGFADRRLTVDFPAPLLARLKEECREAVTDCLAEDPRPSYQDDPNRIYHMKFSGYEIHFTVDNETVYVCDVT